MKELERAKVSHRAAWAAATLVLLLVSALSVAVPRASAQTADQTSAEARRYLQTFDNVYRYVLQNYVDKPDAKKLYEGAMKGLLESLGDPYSVFLSEADMSRINDFAEGDFGGVGLYISKQLKDPKKPADQPLYVEIISPIEDTPGWSSGLRSGDLIEKIDGDSTAPMTIDEAMKRIRGAPGSAVILSILRDGAPGFDISLKRALIETPTVKFALIPRPEGAVGYIRIIQFTPQTAERVADALAQFKRQGGYKALVLDVRNDPGGLLGAAVDTASLFVDKGVIVSTKGRNPLEYAVNSAKPGSTLDKDSPMVLLMNRGSASASEILAGALKDLKRAYLVGENSYGKGLVQRVFPIDDTGFKLTTARYYTPSDENIDKTGIPPDLEVKEPDLTPAESDAAQKLFDSGKLAEFAKAHPKATPEERNRFAELLGKDYPALSQRLRRLAVQNELDRLGPGPVYNLEFDPALTAALSLVAAPDFAGRLAAARSVKDLVEAKKAAAKAAAPAADGAQATLPTPTPSN